MASDKANEVRTRRVLPLAALSAGGSAIGAIVLPVICPITAATGVWSLRYRDRRRRLSRVLGAAAMIIGVLGTIPLLGIRVPPRPADPNVPFMPVNHDLIHAPQVRVELLRFNGAHLPDDVRRRVVERLSKYVNGPVVVTDHGSIDVLLDDEGTLPDHFWPLRDDEGDVTIERLLSAGRTWLPLHSYGVEGARLGSLPMRSENAQHMWVAPVVAPHTILIAIVPVARNVRQLTGWHQPIRAVDDEGNHVGWGSMVVVQVGIIDREAMIGPAQRRLLEWTLFHELGHALGVPSDPKRVQRAIGRHCTSPECVMYSPADWRFMLSMYFNGWAMDLCRHCVAEIEVVRSVDVELLRSQQVNSQQVNQSRE